MKNKRHGKPTAAKFDLQDAGTILSVIGQRPELVAAVGVAMKEEAEKVEHATRLAHFILSQRWPDNLRHG